MIRRSPWCYGERGSGRRGARPRFVPAVLDVEESTMTAYRGCIRNHIRPVLGRL